MNKKKNRPSGLKYTKHKENPTSFKKGHIAWNKGTKGLMSSWNKGKIGIYSEEYREKLSIAHFKNPTRYWLGKSRSQKTKEKIKKTKLKANLKGSKCPAWKGGITPLNYLIRYSEKSREWRKGVLKRDNYICQKCGNNEGDDLEAHHIKSFSEILKELLQKYNRFSPLEDRETLLELSYTYEPFWDISNGKTLCKDCHNSTKKYGAKII